MKNIYFLCFIVFVSSMIFICLCKKKNNTKNTEKNTLFTCTTFLSKPNKYNELDRALSTFLSNYDGESIREYLVINEYSEEDTSEMIETLRDKYPMITFMNKKKNQQGQAYSLNIIIDYLKKHKYKYWIRWEESWYTIRPFFNEAYNIMETTSIDQLQFTENFKDIPSHRVKVKDKHLEIKKRDSYPDYWIGEKDDNWPLFSLRPGIDRVSTILKVGYFNNSKDKWPITFEYDYSLDWVQVGKKGVLKDYSVTRNHDHQSTYSI